MRLCTLAPFLLLLAGCGDKEDKDSAVPGTDGGDDGADGEDTDTDSGADGTDGSDGGEDPEITLQGFAVGPCDPDAPASSARLTASLAGADSIAVRHDNLRTHSCADFSAEISVDGNSIFVYYTDAAAADPCDQQCDYDLSYTLGPLEAGTWTVSAAGSLSDTVIVP